MAAIAAASFWDTGGVTEPGLQAPRHKKRARDLVAGPFFLSSKSSLFVGCLGVARVHLDHILGDDRTRLLAGGQRSRTAR